MKLQMIFVFGVIFVLQNSSFGTTSDFSGPGGLLGIDGWTLEGSGQPLEWFYNGGNPGGNIQFQDIPGSDGDGWIIAPSKFLGDWSSLNGSGLLSWDHKILYTGDVSEIVAPSVIISGPGGNATFTSTSSFQTSWTTFTAPINSSSWTLNSGSWNSLIENVTSMKIRIEAVLNNGPVLDWDGIDNVILDVSEPSTFVLLCIGATVLVAFSWFKRPSSA